MYVQTGRTWDELETNLETYGTVLITIDSSRMKAHLTDRLSTYFSDKYPVSDYLVSVVRATQHDKISSYAASKYGYIITATDVSPNRRNKNFTSLLSNNY